MSYISYEQDILQFWQDFGIFKSITEMENLAVNDVPKIEFDHMDGPPFCSSANIHFGTIFMGSLKDTFLRYHRMHGKKPLNHTGNDCHGLPSEYACMKRLGLTTTEEIEKFGKENFINECLSMIKEFAGSWKPVYDRCGRWADFENVYKTIDTTFMESVWWSFKELHKKGLIYRGYNVMPYSWKLETPLSNFEAGQNYVEIDTNSLYVGFEFVNDSSLNFLAWTTTPWTLPSNLALCVNPNALYMKCTLKSGISYIVGEHYVEKLNEKLRFTNVEFYAKGSDLVGLEYKPLFKYLETTYHKVLADLYVKDRGDIGTGIVHISPSFGDDDCRVCRKAGIVNNKNLDELCPIDSTGKFKSVISDYQGMLVFDADKLIIKDLMANGSGILTQNYKHNYPFCDRTNTPLIYRTTASVFVEATKLKDRMIELNKTIKWSKPEIGENKFHNWLEQTRDWCLTRNRTFGTPIPIWESEDGQESIVIGSIQELKDLSGWSEPITDLHMNNVDHITIISKTSGKVLRRIPDVFDCWYESGSVPFAKIHYPFENAEYFDDKEYLSEFVAEGIDQTRGWFYTLLVLSTALFDKAPFKHCICSGLIMDEHRQKFSKKAGNFIDPMILINKYGSDTLRLYFEKSPLPNAQELYFKESDVNDVAKKLIQYLNGVKFFINHVNLYYANSDIKLQYIGNNYDYDTLDNVTDKWILEKISNLRQFIEQHMNQFHVDKPVHEILAFVEDLTNWYIKLNRLRMKGKYGKHEQHISLSVLYTVLYDYSTITSPFTPFLSEHVYKQLQELISDNLNLMSVHMLQYPNVNRNFGICDSFKVLQNLCSIIRSARDLTTTHRSVKVPIESCTIYEDDPNVIEGLKCLLDVIQDEVNCDKFEFHNVPEKHYSLKPNFKVLGKKYKEKAQRLKTILEEFSSDGISEYLKYGSNTLGIIDVDNIYEILPEEFEIIESVKGVTSDKNIIVKESQGLLLAIDFNQTENGKEKYLVKCFCKEIQNIRKQMGLKQQDKISIVWYTESITLKAIFDKHIETLYQLTPHFKYESSNYTLENELNVFLEKQRTDENASLVDESFKSHPLYEFNLKIKIDIVI